MAKTVHVIGNGDWVHLYTRKERKGLNLTCNLDISDRALVLPELEFHSTEHQIQQDYIYHPI